MFFRYGRCSTVIVVWCTSPQRWLLSVISSLNAKDVKAIEVCQQIILFSGRGREFRIIHAVTVKDCPYKVTLSPISIH